MELDGDSSDDEAVVKSTNNISLNDNKKRNSFDSSDEESNIKSTSKAGKKSLGSDSDSDIGVPEDMDPAAVLKKTLNTASSDEEYNAEYNRNVKEDNGNVKVNR